MNQKSDTAAPGLDADAFRNLVNTSVCLIDNEIASSASYFGGVKLSGVDVFRYDGVGFRRGYRTNHHIRGDRIDDFMICLPIDAHIDVKESLKNPLRMESLDIDFA